MIAIVDYGAGNLHSVKSAVRALGGDAEATNDGGKILSADGVILPGVGSFGSAAKMLFESGLDKVCVNAAKSGKPFFGICLGMQLLFEKSEESPGVLGLGILEGEILKIPSAPGRKIPHMGWNRLDIQKPSALFEGCGGEYVYFVHSYYVRADDRYLVAAVTDYGVAMDVAVERENIFATQFHPEKSGHIGMKILHNFIKTVRNGD